MMDPYFVHYTGDRELIGALIAMPKEMKKAKTPEELQKLSLEAEIIAEALRYRYLKLFLGRTLMELERTPHHGVKENVNLHYELVKNISSAMNKIYGAHRIRFHEIGGGSG